MDNDELKTLQSQFKLICRKCGSDDVVMDCEEGIDYGGMTGYQEGHLSIGCNSCKQNDFHSYL